MQIATTVKPMKKTLRGITVTQKSEITLLTDNSGNYFIKSGGKSTKMSRESAQDYFQKNFDDFWKYLELNNLHERFPELYTKEEATEIEKSYATTPKKETKDKGMKIKNYYENFASFSY